MDREARMCMGFSSGASGQESTAFEGNVRDTGSTTGSGRAYGGGHGNPVQYSCLERILWTEEAGRLVHRITKSRT